MPWRELLSHALLVATASLLSWGLYQIVDHRERLSVLESTAIRGADATTIWTKIGEHEQRLNALESGISTPMAASTRERFDAVDRRIDAIERRTQ